MTNETNNYIDKKIDLALHAAKEDERITAQVRSDNHRLDLLDDADRAERGRFLAKAAAGGALVLAVVGIAASSFNNLTPAGGNINDSVPAESQPGSVGKGTIIKQGGPIEGGRITVQLSKDPRARAFEDYKKSGKLTATP